MKKLMVAVTLVVGLAGSLFATETKTYTAKGTVSEKITGDTEVVVDVSDAYTPTGGDPTGWKGIVEFTAENDFTGDVTVYSGAVKVSNRAALGTGKIKLHPHTALFVAVSYKDSGTSLNAAIIDRIEVQNPDNLAEPDLWVAFLVQGDGIKNDVDFSNQPNLWLSAPKSMAGWQNDYQTLNGTLTPYGDTYKFGYNFVHYTENTCLAVDGLCDKADGTPRNVVFRGFSTHTLGKNLTFTGRIRIEDGAVLNVNSTSGLGPIPAEARTNQIVIAGQNCGFNPRCNSMSFSEKIGITVEPGAAVTFYPSGSVTENLINTFKGPLCGSGTITMGDNGGFAFTATNNSFSGNISLGTHNRQQWFKIGNGANFSWGRGGTFTFGGVTADVPQHLVLTTDADADFGMKVVGKGRLVKRGAGTLTLTQPLAKTYLAGLPTVSVEGGTLKRGVAESTAMTGWTLLSAGATFDLNGLAAANVYLPYGAGSIVNPAADADIVISNPAQTNDVTFAGRIAGHVRLTNTASVPWRVGPGATFDGGLEVCGGEVQLEEGATLSDALTVGEKATLSCAANVRVADFDGAGTVRPAVGGSWPTVTGVNAFAGLYQVAGVVDAGTLMAAGGSAVSLSGELGPSAPWKFACSSAGHTYATNLGHRAAFVLTDGYKSEQYSANNGGVHSPSKVDVRSPWKMSFTVRTSPGFGWGTSTPSYGDGFAMVFQSQNQTAYGGLAKYSDDTKALCSVAGSYGLHFWSDGKSFTWVRDMVRNADADARLTDKSVLGFSQWKTDPMKVVLTYDGTKMVAQFTIGSTTLTTTNAKAGDDLAERFADGAYISFLSSAGGWSCGITIEDFCFNHTPAPQPELGGTLRLVGGEEPFEFVSDGAESLLVSADLAVAGPATIARTSETPLAFTGAEWSFDFATSETPSVSFPANVQLPAAVSVVLVGAKERLPTRWMTIADLSAYAAAGGTLPTFTVTATSGAYVRSRVKDGKLQVKLCRGMVLFFR